MKCERCLLTESESDHGFWVEVRDRTRTPDEPLADEFYVCISCAKQAGLIPGDYGSPQQRGQDDNR